MSEDRCAHCGDAANLITCQTCLAFAVLLTTYDRRFLHALRIAL